VIYLDTSVALAHLLAEDRRVPDALWAETLVSSRVLEYELWNRIHARGLTKSHGEAVRELLRASPCVSCFPRWTTPARPRGDL
jgi:hypothetical protein